MLLKDRSAAREPPGGRSGDVNASLLAVLVMAVLLAALARRYNVSAPLALVVAGVGASMVPRLDNVEVDPECVLFVILPPLLWSAGLESSYVALRKNVRAIGLLAIGLPLATTSPSGSLPTRPCPS